MCVRSDGWMFSFSRILFKDKERNWDEIENKLRSESETPLLKTSNKVERLFRPSVFLYLHLLDGHHFFSFYQEISSILFELKRVEKQLQGKDTLSCFIMKHIKTGQLKNKFYVYLMNIDPLSSSSCFCLSDQRDGRSRRNIRCFGQPWPGQPHHPHPASNQQNCSLRHQPRVRPRSQTVPARDPSWSWRVDSQGSAFFSQQRGRHRTWPRAGVNGRTVVQSHAAEWRGGHCTEVNAFPEVWIWVRGWVSRVAAIQNHLKGVLWLKVLLC